MTGYAAAAGIALINSIGNLGGFLAPVMRSGLDDSVGGNAGLYALALGAVAAGVLLAATGLFPRANAVEAGEAETLRGIGSGAANRRPATARPAGVEGKRG